MEYYLVEFEMSNIKLIIPALDNLFAEILALDMIKPLSNDLKVKSSIVIKDGSILKFEINHAKRKI